jgi:hypothetical protein
MKTKQTASNTPAHDGRGPRAQRRQFMSTKPAPTSNVAPPAPAPSEFEYTWW